MKKESSENILPALSKQKKMLFSIILVLIPIFIVAVLELGLRILKYGDDLSLFKKSFDYPGYYEINKKVSNRYFSKTEGPGPSNDIFLINKPDNSFRIFVLGSSTTRGFPYSNGIMFPRILNYRLQDVFPDWKIEVINMSMTAVNSFTQADFIDEILDQKPDAILIYAGHNEFYGALGVASIENGGNLRWLKRLNLSLVHLRTYQLIQKLIVKASSFSASAINTQQNSTRMELIVKNKSIEYGSPVYFKAIEDFRLNMGEVLRKTKKKNIPVLFGELVCNIRDQKPFKSIPIANYPTADDAFLKARNYELEEKFDSALVYYNLAKDLDGVKFRAPEDINKVIYEISEKYNAHIVHTKKYFENFSPNRLVGDNLMLEHLHPNIDGYFLLADAFFDAMHENKLISAQWDSSHIKTSTYYRSVWGFTKLDSMVANIKIQSLKESWPFKPENVVNNFIFDYKPKNYEDSMAIMCVLYKNIYIENKHKELATYYAGLGRYSDAYSEFNSLVRSYPYITEYYIEAEKYASLAKEYARGLDLLLTYPDKDSSFIINLKIGKLYQKLKSPKNALDYYYKAQEAILPEDSKELLLVSYLSAYNDIGDSVNAKIILKKIQTINPNFNPNVDLKEKQAIIVVGKEWKSLIDRSIILAKGKNFNKALELLNQAQKIKETALGNQLIGSILFEQGNPDALRYILKAYYENPTDADLLNNLVVLYINQKDYKNAYKYVEELKLVTSEPAKVKKMEDYIIKKMN